MNKIATLVWSTLVASMLIRIAFAQTPQTTPQLPQRESAPAEIPGVRSGARPTPPPVTPIVSMTQPNPDPRVGLAPGRWDAGQAAWNMRLISTTPPSAPSAGA